MPAVIASFIISTLAHFVVGASKALVTTRSWWASGAEMTLVGILEAAITYGARPRVRGPLTSCLAAVLATDMRRITALLVTRLIFSRLSTAESLAPPLPFPRQELRRRLAGGARCWKTLTISGLPGWSLIGDRRAGGASHRPSARTFRCSNDIATSVNRYTQFTIFDDVSASVKDGVVTLTGKVTMPYKRDDIEKRVAKVDGVRQVRDRHHGAAGLAVRRRAALRIARSIYGNSNFWNYAIMANPPIHIVVEHGRVTLTGVVSSNVDRMLARSLATQFGALSVTNELKTDAEVRERA